MTSGGTIQGLSLNLVIWIRDDWWLPRCSMPDNRNDEIEGSLICEKLAEKKPLKA
jgi:hypothetical protein